VDDADWTAFQWIAANVDGRYDVFMSHPWKAVVLTAMTGKTPHTWLSPGSPPVRNDDYVEYLASLGNDPLWLAERDISMVTQTYIPSGPDYEQVAQGIALLRPDLAAEMHELRMEQRARASSDAG
jgi:hypothetical protein